MCDILILQRQIFEVKTMRVDSRMIKYNPRNPNRRAVEKRVAEIEAHYTRRTKKLDVKFHVLADFEPTFFFGVYFLNLQ